MLDCEVRGGFRGTSAPKLGVFPFMVMLPCGSPWTQELEVITLATVALLSKYRKMATFDEFLERLFFHGKAAVTILLFLVGLGHMVSYLIAWIGEFSTCCFCYLNELSEVLTIFTVVFAPG